MRNGRIAVGITISCALALFAFTLPTAAVTRAPMHPGDPTRSQHTSAFSADEGTNRGGLSRDGWYPEASLLTPSNVAKDKFGLLSSVPVTGQLYAQPVMDGSNVIAATEENWVYAINQVTGAREWAVQVGANIGAQPFNNVQPTDSSLQPWGCSDLAPYVGITSTPVVDPSTGIIYVVAMEQLTDGTLGYFMHALNPVNGDEEPNFPVEVEGTPQNNSNTQFVAYDELQRVALTLTGGVVYFGFSSYCDTYPYQGYVAGVSETGHLSALWSDINYDTDSGAGIWQAGGGFASDAVGQIIGASGNGEPGASPAGTIPGNSPPTTGSLSESDFRLVAQKDGSLEATDFFTPYDAGALDNDDLDFGSGAPVLLPSEFATSADPDLLIQTGKEGYVYLLNARNLGGVSPGDAGALAVQGPDGGAWATPGVWPGDGGYIYIPTSDGGTLSLGNSTQGDFNVFRVVKPTAASSSFGLDLVAKGPEPVGFGTSSPIVTSNGTKSGSGVVWIVELQDGGTGVAQLQAYDAVPSAGNSGNPGTLKLIHQWPIGDGMKFTPPGVGDNRLFVPTMDNKIMVFGLHAPAIATGRGASFVSTEIGRRSTVTIPVVAQRAFSILKGADGCGVCTRTTQFKIVSTSPAFRGGKVSVGAGRTLYVTATFNPVGTPGLRSDVLRLVTSLGEVDFTLSGVGRASGPWLVPSTLGLTLPGYVIGQKSAAQSTIVFTNFGSLPARITGYGSSETPFVVSGLPRIGTLIGPGGSFKALVSFRSGTSGTFHKVLIVKTNSPVAVATSSVDLNAVASAAASR